MEKLLILIFCLFWGCAIDQPLSSNTDNVSSIQITPFGTDNSLDIITWNVENFPKNGNNTVDAMVDIIRDLDIEIFAFQEIESSSSFNNLISSLECSEIVSTSFGDCNEYLGWANTENGCAEIIGCNNDINYNFYLDYEDCNKTCNAEWDGFRSNSASYSMNLAYLYNKSKVTINNIYELYNDDWWSFPRSPLVLELTYNGIELILINNHFKCCDGSEDRRESAMNLLHQYVIDEFNNKRVIILGDLNDSITDSESSNVFINIINDSSFYFADISIATGPASNWSFPTYPSHIDHIIISNELFDNFDNDIKTIKIDEELNGGWSEYDLKISDHRPLGIRLNFNN